MVNVYAVVISYDLTVGSSRQYRGTFRGSSVVEVQTTAARFASQYLHAVRITGIAIERTTQS